MHALPDSAHRVLRTADNAAAGVLVFGQALVAIVGSLVLSVSTLWTASTCEPGAACGERAWVWPVAAVALSAIGGLLLLNRTGRWIKSRVAQDLPVLGVALLGAVAEAVLLAACFQLAQLAG
ncbi:MULTISPECIES: hypothetical protein [unclassified Gordonia (in: high G+C Gram-positive bacteria)]|uniref:hypothetical protein n=1 Tax=unclassified Gordonia (in: high G+C Gram-positive bacteria) TaxID=2657482 RepID=UPI001FFFF6F0|nr:MULTISPECIES: hypothetical protein [unclassified Gordonia (in: high G+C Gram-positive bacteria)]UQE75695.1 hypothetical protein MYK68_03485 [Gordonia sp. PP30]